MDYQINSYVEFECLKYQIKKCRTNKNDEIKIYEVEKSPNDKYILITSKRVGLQNEKNFTLFQRITHKHLLEYYSHWQVQEYDHYILEYYDATLSLYFDQINNSEISLAFRQIALGLENLHSNFLFHGNLKYEDIFIKFIYDNNKMQSSYKIGNYYYLQTQKIETFQNNKQKDIWDLGNMIYNLITKNKFRYFNLQDKQEQIDQNIQIAISNNYDMKPYLMILQQMLKVNIAERITIQNVNKSLNTRGALVVTNLLQNMNEIDKLKSENEELKKQLQMYQGQILQLNQQNQQYQQYNQYYQNEIIKRDNCILQLQKRIDDFLVACKQQFDQNQNLNNNNIQIQERERQLKQTNQQNLNTIALQYQQILKFQQEINKQNYDIFQKNQEIERLNGQIQQHEESAKKKIEEAFNLKSQFAEFKSLYENVKEKIEELKSRQKQKTNLSNQQN